ncbi:MAG TPA: hypothetical protein VML95_07570 [Longimicrobiales bacterium]|nr:hypothetical protein [Longimicrobiales bacterium]
MNSLKSLSHDILRCSLWQRVAYSRYLALRPEPEPGPAADAVAEARAELAALRRRID